MITKLILDIIGHYKNGRPTELLRAGLPIALVDLVGGEGAEVRLPDGEIVHVPAAAVEAGHEPEETLNVLSEALGIPYDTLVRYAREGRILARRSGNVYLTTRTAVQYAGIKPRQSA